MAEGMFNRYRANLNRVQEEFDTGQRNLGEYILGTGYYGVAKPIESAIEAITPDLGVGQFLGEQLAKTGIPQYVMENTSERTRRNLGEGLGLFGVTPLGRSAQAVKETTQRFIQTMPNDLNFGGSAQFYLPKPDALRIAKDKNPNLTGPALESAAQDVQRSSRAVAQVKGLGKGISNFIQQSLSPQGMAEWNQRGVSKTLTDLMRSGDDGLSREKWGQAAWENLTSRQYGNLNKALTQLNDEFFTYQGVLSPKDFSSFSKLPESDSGAFFRTILSAQGIDPKKADDVIMVGRQPTGREYSGSLVTDAMNMTPVARKLPAVFQLEAPFKSADEFLDAYDKGFSARVGKTSRKINPLTPEQRFAIRQTFVDNPRLTTITDPVELREELKRALPGSAGENFGVAQVVKDATRGGKQMGFKTNDALAKAMQEAFPNKKILRNSQQSKDPDVFITDSFTSDAYELGGVNVVYKVNKNGDLTAVVNDMNDIGVSGRGIDVSAPFGKKLVVVTEPITKNVLDLEGNVDYTPPPASGGLRAIQEELQTPAQAGLEEYVDVFGTPTAVTGMAFGSEEEDPLAPTIQ